MRSESVVSLLGRRDVVIDDYLRGSHIVQDTHQCGCIGWDVTASKNAKRTAVGIPTWSPTVVLIYRFTA
ncbi:hypothetical protein EJ03DRAFT_4569 [Teratosphaeria nubilosa]|uniref:Uncharacterized protein n=1 Tax=Teratosphaeria nubilosa TaxID=161662 RepID=A0A6G1LN55_9PEZI|nr:hypothetical protein EJ03DRAFT_4569 [Teratosphaeria nubilosa]